MPRTVAGKRDLAKRTHSPHVFPVPTIAHRCAHRSGQCGRCTQTTHPLTHPLSLGLWTGGDNNWFPPTSYRSCEQMEECFLSLWAVHTSNMVTPSWMYIVPGSCEYKTLEVSNLWKYRQAWSSPSGCFAPFWFYLWLRQLRHLLQLETLVRAFQILQFFKTAQSVWRVRYVYFLFCFCANSLPDKSID